MISILFYFTFFINLILVLARKKSTSCAIALWTVLLLVYAGNIRSGFSDLTYYRQRYYEGLNDIFFQDKGYVWLANSISDRGWSFQILLAVLFLLSSVLLYFIAKKLRCSYNLLLVLYSLFYFFYGLEVIRFFLAVSIAALGYYCLSQGRKFQFIFWLLLASQFHASILFVLPFLFFYSTKEKNRKITLLIAFSIALIVLNYLNGNRSDYLISFFGNIVNTESTRERIQFYTSNSTRLGFLIYYMYFMFNMVIIYHLKKIASSIKTMNDRQQNFLHCVYQQNLFCSIFLPLIMFNVTFFRYIIFTTVLNFIVYAMMYPYGEYRISNRNSQIMIAGSVIGFTVLWWIMKENVLMFYEALIPNLFN